MLKNEIQQKYSENIGDHIKIIELNDIEEDWENISKAVKEIAPEIIGKIKNKKKMV